MARTHYHVVENTRGYLPESEPISFDTKAAAGSYALSLANELREQGHRVSGNQRDGYTAEDPSKMYDLGRVIEILPCSDPACNEEEYGI